MKIAVLVSGGVDSSVALHLLREEGHDLTAYYLKIWLEDDLAHLGECPWQTDLEYVRAVCDKLSVPLKIISLQRDYWDNVVQYTLDEVKAGRTPNPDIFCNHRIKFGKFYERIDDSFEGVATGHYARKITRDGIAYLGMADDPVKDQTYFLSHLSQAQLARALFPIGEFPKNRVREIANSAALPTAARKDSQGICFLGTIRFSEFIRHHMGERKGDLIEFETGEKKGEHQGYWYFTIGQRQGIGLHGGPWYVVERDVDNNRIYISNSYHATDKRRDGCVVENLHWISGFEPPLGEEIELKVKVRHGPQTYDSKVRFLEGGAADITFDRSDQGLAAGQFAVFYQHSICLGNGVIAADGLGHRRR